ncbi:MAG: hypothetical protein BJ554DRAFT_4354, partial [Olpidium bornovanus]
KAQVPPSHPRDETTAAAAASTKRGGWHWTHIFLSGAERRSTEPTGWADTSARDRCRRYRRRLPSVAVHFARPPPPGCRRRPTVRQRGGRREAVARTVAAAAPVGAHRPPCTQAAVEDRCICWQAVFKYLPGRDLSDGNGDVHERGDDADDAPARRGGVVLGRAPVAVSEPDAAGRGRRGESRRRLVRGPRVPAIVHRETVLLRRCRGARHPEPERAAASVEPLGLEAPGDVGRR